MLRATLLLMTGFTAACTAGADLASFDGLAQRVQEYYTHEQKNEWDKAYYFRAPAYRKTVPLDYYLENMKKDNTGWKLREFRVIDATKKGDKVYIKMAFVEEGPVGFFPKSLLPKDFTVTEDHGVKLELKGKSVWKRMGDVWYCYDAVSRMHLPLNEAIVEE